MRRSELIAQVLLEAALFLEARCDSKARLERIQRGSRCADCWGIPVQWCSHCQDAHALRALARQDSSSVCPRCKGQGGTLYAGCSMCKGTGQILDSSPQSGDGAPRHGYWVCDNGKMWPRNAVLTDSVQFVRAEDYESLREQLEAQAERKV